MQPQIKNQKSKIENPLTPESLLQQLARSLAHFDQLVDHFNCSPDDLARMLASFQVDKLLKARLATLAYPVILTGAMTPLGFERSDGLQNLTESLFAARTLAPGVWIVVHNQVFDVDHARKDREHARFVAC